MAEPTWSTRPGPKTAETQRRSEPHLQNLTRPDKKNAVRKAHPNRNGAPGGSQPSAGENLAPVDLDRAQTAPVATVETVTAPVPPSIPESTVPQSIPAPGESKPVVAETHERTPAPDRIQPPTGVAWLEGRSLRFPGGIKIAPGERFEVAGHIFETRKAAALTPRNGLRWGGLGLVGLFALIGLGQLLVGSPSGALTGVVLDRTTGRIVPDAHVNIHGGPVIRANAAGLYLAQNLASGSYNLTATAPGYTPQTGSVIHDGDQTTQLAFALIPLTIDSSRQTEAAGDGPREAEPEPVAAADRPRVAYGHVVLDVDFNGYLVFVDNILYGKNSQKVKRLTAGRHTIVLQLDGYEDHSTTVKIKARATETIRITKADLKTRANPRKRAKAHFAAAQEHSDNGQWLKAIEEYNSGLALDPEDGHAYQYRGWSYLKARQRARARSDFIEAARLHAATNRYLDAVACAGYLIDLNPDDATAYQRRAEYYIALTEYGRAIEDYKSAVKRDKYSSEHRLGLAEAFFVAGHYKNAAKEFDRARKLVSDPSDIYVRMLFALTRAGEDGKVRKKYKAFTEFADPDRLERLRQNPEWLRVLQIVDPMERSEG